MVVLRDGSEVIVRQLTPADAPMLAAAFERLSAESRDLRFLGGKPELTASDLRYLTEVDGHVHEALVAIDPQTRRGIGVARFVRLGPEEPVAEVAVTVADEWQRRGLGTALLEELTERAREEGIERYTALVSAENDAVVALLYGIGAHVHEGRTESGVVAYEVELSPSGLGHSLGAALRAAASGRMHVPKRVADALAALLAREDAVASRAEEPAQPQAEETAQPQAERPPAAQRAP
jgi:GNAT superfamily N-acetyltransferase